MPENEEGPEHGPLSYPIERPHYPVIEICCRHREPKDDHHVTHHVAHRSPRVLDPAMPGYGLSDLRQPERRWRSRVERFLLHATPHRGTLLQGRHLQLRAHPERPVPAAGETDRATDTRGGRGKTPPPQWLEASGRRDAGSGARQGGGEKPEATALEKNPTRHCKNGSFPLLTVPFSRNSLSFPPPSPLLLVVVPSQQWLVEVDLRLKESITEKREQIKDRPANPKREDYSGAMESGRGVRYREQGAKSVRIYKGETANGV